MASNVAMRAKRKGGGVDLATLEIVALRCGGFCEVSGMPLYLGSDKRHPYQPSLDRRDSAQGYTAENVRIVALSVNLCMSHWGEQVFLQIAAATLSKTLQKMAGMG
jgi:hypothetical protein